MFFFIYVYYSDVYIYVKLLGSFDSTLTILYSLVWHNFHLDSNNLAAQANEWLNIHQARVVGTLIIVQLAANNQNQVNSRQMKLEALNRIKLSYFLHCKSKNGCYRSVKSCRIDRKHRIFLFFFILVVTINVDMFVLILICNINTGRF